MFAVIQLFELILGDEGKVIQLVIETIVKVHRRGAQRFLSDGCGLVLRRRWSGFLLLVILSVLELRQDLARVSRRVVVIGVLGCLSLCTLLARVARVHVLVMIELELVDFLLRCTHIWNFNKRNLLWGERR